MTLRTGTTKDPDPWWFLLWYGFMVVFYITCGVTAHIASQRDTQAKRDWRIHCYRGGGGPAVPSGRISCTPHPDKKGNTR